MFENFGTAIVQALGFFAVFGFFIYRLLSEKVSNNSLKDNTQKPVKRIASENKGLFGRKRKVEENIDIQKKENKKGWFKR